MQNFWQIFPLTFDFAKVKLMCQFEYLLGPRKATKNFKNFTALHGIITTTAIRTFLYQRRRRLFVFVFFFFAAAITPIRLVIIISDVYVILFLSGTCQLLTISQAAEKTNKLGKRRRMMARSKRNRFRLA